jgi:hypothetical protein
MRFSPSITCPLLIAFAAALTGCGPEPAAHAQTLSTKADSARNDPESQRGGPSTASAEEAKSVQTDDATAKPQGSGWSPNTPLRDWEYIVLHHTATGEGDVRTINKEHQKRKDSDGNAWRGIGYHFLIGNGKGMKDGQIEPTFRWTEQLEGAHAGSLKHNERGIGVCLVGDFSKSRPTKKQRESLGRLLAWLKSEAGIPSERVLKHSDIRPTACPGSKFVTPK